MCGICGIYEYGSRAPVREEILGGMLSSIRHRGPDDEGLHLDHEIGLGVRRLSIIDVEGGRQPIANEDGSVVVVCNGEVYNYRELASELRNRGHRLKTASDTEVIVHLYEDLGEECIHRLRGMFAFALWDARRQRLLLARDRLGIKPLYYADGRRLVFGSEIKCLFRDPQLVPRPNLEALSNFLSLKYVPAPQTMFAGIAALPPGHLLTCDRNGVAVRRYWDLTFSRSRNGHRREEDWAQELAALLRETVQSHLVSDVPFGAFLSGGLDSSTVVALMSQCLERPVKTYSVGYDGDGAAFSELPYARLVARLYGTDHHEVIVAPHHLTDLAETIVWHLDQPIADEAALASYVLAEFAARDVKMVLTGEGGDELFAGYARYAGERFSPWFGALPRPAKSLALAATGRLPRLQRAKLALYAWCQPEEIARLTNWFPLANPEMKAALLSEELKHTLSDRAPERVFAHHLARSDATDPLSRMLYLDTKLWLPDDLLARGDKTSMAASLEARVPLLDHKLVEFAGSLPPQLKLKGLTRKYLLKKVGRAWLPAKILDRKKKGFPTPISVWFRKQARPFLHDLLSPSTIARRGLFDPRYVQRLLQDHDHRRADHGSLFWALINVELWHRIFIDSSVALRGPRPDTSQHRLRALRVRSAEGA